MHTTLGVHSSQPQDEGLLTSTDAYVTLVKMISLQTALLSLIFICLLPFISALSLGTCFHRIFSPLILFFPYVNQQ